MCADEGTVDEHLDGAALRTRFDEIDADDSGRVTIKEIAVHEQRKAEAAEAEAAAAAAATHSDSQANSLGWRCHSTLSLAAMDCHSLGIQTVMLLSLLSCSTNLTVLPMATGG